jgi:hypothetical protein
LRGKLKHEELYRGDLVEVRSPSEILATLDESGALATLPFMPEMFVYCGRRFTVDHRADEICDTVKHTKRSLFVQNCHFFVSPNA